VQIGFMTFTNYKKVIKEEIKVTLGKPLMPEGEKLLKRREWVGLTSSLLIILIYGAAVLLARLLGCGGEE